MKRIHFGIGSQYGNGKSTSIAINDHRSIVEVHQSKGYETLWHHVGKQDGLSVEWSPSKQYDKGVSPSVDINNHGIVIEVHRSNGLSTKLWYHTGKLDGNTLSWSNSVCYDKGSTPSVAINDHNAVVEVHKSEGQDTLWCRVGIVENDVVSWSGSSKYDNGISPDVTVNNNGIVVEVHRSNDASDNLWYCVGKVNGRKLTWKESRKIADRKGASPSVAINDKNEVTVVYHNGKGLYSLTGLVTGNAVSWTEEKNKSFDSGVDANVSAAAGSDVVIQSHCSEVLTGLFYTCSLLVNTERWMEANWNALKGKTLPRVVLPGSHDSAMYETSLGQTQRLSIYEQLCYGIRFFDLRPGYDGKNFYIYHGPIKGPKLETVLGDVAKFFINRGEFSVEDGLQHPHPVGLPSGNPPPTQRLEVGSLPSAHADKEITILKFSHYKNFSDPVFKEFVDMIKHKIGNQLYKDTEKRPLCEIPLEKFKDLKTPVIAVFDDGYPDRFCERENGILKYYDGYPGSAGEFSVEDGLRHPHPVGLSSGNPPPTQRLEVGVLPSTHADKSGSLSVFDQYSDKIVLENMIADQLKKYISFSGQDDGKTYDLFLLSWTLTPPTLVPKFSQAANRILFQNISKMNIPNQHGQIPNILYVDCVEDARVTELAIDLNQRI